MPKGFKNHCDKREREGGRTVSTTAAVDPDLFFSRFNGQGQANNACNRSRSPAGSSFAYSTWSYSGSTTGRERWYAAGSSVIPLLPRRRALRCPSCSAGARERPCARRIRKPTAVTSCTPPPGRAGSSTHAPSTESCGCRWGRLAGGLGCWCTGARAGLGALAKPQLQRRDGDGGRRRDGGSTESSQHGQPASDVPRSERARERERDGAGQPVRPRADDAAAAAAAGTVADAYRR